MSVTSTITADLIDKNTSNLMDAIGQVDDSLILLAERARQNNLPARKEKTWKRSALAACFCLATLGLIIGLNSGELKTVFEEGGGMDIESEFYLDSSRNASHSSAEETDILLQSIDPDDVISAKLFINQGTAAGNMYELTMKDDADLLYPLARSLFSDNLHYSKTEREYKGNEYDFYVTFALSGDKGITVFVADTGTLRCNGYFFAVSEELDFAPVNEIIHKFLAHRISEGGRFLDSSLNYSGRTAGQVENLLNDFCRENVTTVEVYMNTSTSIGTLFTLTREADPESVSGILEMFFGSSNHYAQTEYDFSRYYNTNTTRDHTGEYYQLYVTFRFSADMPDLNIFVIDENTLRCDSFFFTASALFDFTKLIELIELS